MFLLQTPNNVNITYNSSVWVSTSGGNDSNDDNANIISNSSCSVCQPHSVLHAVWACTIAGIEAVLHTSCYKLQPSPRNAPSPPLPCPGMHVWNVWNARVCVWEKDK